jgi:hypothetical protein
MNLEELPGILKKLEDFSGRDKALLDAFNEHSSALADILDAMTKQGDTVADAVAKALKSVHLQMAAPEVKVNVPAPVVNITSNDKPRKWRFQVKYTPGGAIDEITATST